MRILILVRILWTAGAQKIAISEAKTLTSMGHKVKLVFLRSEPSGNNLLSELKSVDYEIMAPEEYKSKKIFIYITTIFSHERKAGGTVDYDLLRSFSKSFMCGDFDYIICHDPWAGYAGYKIHKRCGVPYSVMIHERFQKEPGHFPLGYITDQIQYKILKSASSIFTVTKKVEESLTEKFGLSGITNYPGMDLKSHYDFLSKTNTIIASATWDRDRDPRRYLRILEHLSDFNLLIVGRWRNEEDYEKFLNELSRYDYAKQVMIKTSIDEQSLQELYASAKFSIRFGTNEYGLGTSNIEAISHLTPVIIDSQLGLVDIVNNLGGGLVVENENFDEVSTFIKLNNVKESYEILQKNLIKITNQYTWKAHCEILIKI